MIVKDLVFAITPSIESIHSGANKVPECFLKVVVVAEIRERKECDGPLDAKHESYRVHRPRTAAGVFA